MVDDPADLRSARVVHECTDSQPRQRSSWSSSAEVDGKHDLGAEGTELVDRSDRFVILRHATDDDAEALNSFDVGDPSIPWLAEVAEIVQDSLVGDPIRPPPMRIARSSSPSRDGFDATVAELGLPVQR